METVIIAVLCILLGAFGAYLLIDYGYRAGAAMRSPAPVQPESAFPRVAQAPWEAKKPIFTASDYDHMKQAGRATVFRPGR